jgi:hypothetical protein
LGTDERKKGKGGIMGWGKQKERGTKMVNFKNNNANRIRRLK